MAPAAAAAALAALPATINSNAAAQLPPLPSGRRSRRGSTASDITPVAEPSDRRLSSPRFLIGSANSSPVKLRAQGVLRTLRKGAEKKKGGKRGNAKNLAAVALNLDFESEDDESNQSILEKRTDQSVVNFAQFLRHTSATKVESQSDSVGASGSGNATEEPPESGESAPEDYQPAVSEAQTSQDEYETADEQAPANTVAIAVVTLGRASPNQPDADQPEPRYSLRRTAQPRRKSCCEGEGNCDEHQGPALTIRKRSAGQREPPGASDQSAKYTLFQSAAWYVKPNTNFAKQPIPNWPALATPAAQDLLEREMTFSPLADDDDATEAHGSAYRTKPSAQSQNRKRVGPSAARATNNRDVVTDMERSSSFLADEPDLADLLRS